MKKDNRMKRYRLLAILMTVLAMCVAGNVEMSAQKKSGKAPTTKTAVSKTGKSGNKKNTGVSKDKKSPAAKTGSRKKGKNTSPAKPETSSDIKRRQEETRREIALTQEQIKQNERDVRRGLNDLGKLKGDITAGEKLLADATAQVNSVETQISDIESKIATNENELTRLREEYLKAVKKMRAKKQNNSMLSFIFSARNFNDAMRRMRYMKEFSGWRERQNNEIAGHVAELRKEKEELAKAKDEKAKVMATQAKAQASLKEQYARQDAVVAGLKANGQALKSHLARKQAEANELKVKISALIAQEQAKAKAEADRAAKAEAEKKTRQEKEKMEAERRKQLAQKNVATDKETAKAEPLKPEKDSKTEKKAQDTKGKKENKASKGKEYAEARKRKPRTQADDTKKNAPSESANLEKTAASDKATASAASGASGFEKMKGSLPKPVSGSFKVTSPFGRHALPELPDVMYDNPGIDAEVAAGASAQAVYGGKVSGVYMIPGYSTVVIVNHGNYYTVYGNIQSASVKVGDSVSQGQALGRLAPGEDDPGHSLIHFEVWHNREKLNPSAWIR